MPTELPGVRHIIAVGSGKGGVGKTTITLQLALALERAGRAVGVFDADIYGPNIAGAFDVQGKSSRDTWMPIARASSVPYIQPLRRFGILAMSLGMFLPEGRAARPDARFLGGLALQTLRDTLWGDLDFLLIDFPPGTGEPQRTLLTSLGLKGVLLVTTPSTPAIADTERAADWIERDGNQVLGVVENLAHMACPACGARIRLFDAAVADSKILSQYPLVEAVPWTAHLAGQRLTDAVETAAGSSGDSIARWLLEQFPGGAQR